MAPSTNHGIHRCTSQHHWAMAMLPRIQLAKQRVERTLHVFLKVIAEKIVVVGQLVQDLEKWVMVMGEYG